MGKMALARVRVEMKPGSRCDDRAFKILFQEFRKRCSDAGIQHDIKEHQFFESKAAKARKKKREIINKRVQEDIEAKLSRGEKVHCSSKLIKKIRSKQAKNARQAKKEGYRDRDKNF
jgi:ribosomal protein S21